MPINSTDLKLLKAERMTDTADGGGRMTQVAVVDGLSNNVFGPLSSIDNAAGNLRLRKVFLAVQADNNEALFSANLFLSTPPADPNVNVFMLDRDNAQDIRADAVAHVPTILNSATEQFYGLSALAVAASNGATALTVGALFHLLPPELQTLYQVPLTALAPPGGTGSALATYSFTVPTEQIQSNTLDLVFNDDQGVQQVISDIAPGTSVANGKYTLTVNYATGAVTIAGNTYVSANPISLPLTNLGAASATVTTYSQNLGYTNIVGSSLLFNMTTSIGPQSQNAFSLLSGTSWRQVLLIAGGNITTTINVATGDMTTVISGSGLNFNPSTIQFSFQYLDNKYRINPYTLSYACTARANKAVIFKPGNLVTVHNSVTVAAATYSNGNTVNFARTNIAAVTVRDSAGAVVSQPGRYTVNFATGILTWVAVAGISMPVTIEHRVEDNAQITSIVGNVLNLNQAISRAYATSGTFVSSVLNIGDMQARVSAVFDQQTWTGVWSDSLIGNPLLANFDLAKWPIIVNNIGCQQERWLLLFDTATTFKIIGESVGIVGSGNITSNASPNNPATGKPYFTLDFRAWGAGWVAGNCLRFNTIAAAHPVWLFRSVNPAVLAQTTDTFRLVARGNAI
jgi:hypothetical protein